MFATLGMCKLPRVIYSNRCKKGKGKPAHPRNHCCGALFVTHLHLTPSGIEQGIHGLTLIPNDKMLD